MTFRKRFIRFLCGFIATAGCFFMVVYGIIESHNKTEETYNLLEQNAAVVAASFDSIIETSNSAINLIISDPEVLIAIRNLSTGKTRDFSVTEKYYSDEYKTIRERTNLYYLYKYCYRVVFFNECGDVIASNYSRGTRRIDGNGSAFIDELNSLNAGELLLIPAHNDQWNSKSKHQLVSVVKRLAGNNMGYFEIQWLEKDIKELLLASDKNYSVCIYDETGRRIFSNDEQVAGSYKLVEEQNKSAGVVKDGKKLLAYTFQNGYYTVIGTEFDWWKDVTIPILPVLFGLMLTFGIISMIFAGIGAETLSKPINILQSIITKTDYENLSRYKLSVAEQQELRQVVEIDNTYKVYEQMLDRLKESKMKAEKMSYLQLRAQLDLMQAQVNPHFIYNVLNIISAKGLLAEDESICDMCDNLSKILRYSTNVKRKEATLREEVDYLRDYLMLLKCRYEDRLDYSISIDRDIWSVIIPKLAIQQIVENAVNHGFSDNVDTLRIEIEAKHFSNGWRIIIQDNGRGIDEEKLGAIKNRLIELNRQLNDCYENVEFEIGGMGIFNTYSRLYLLYKENLKFDINSNGAGTTVIIEVGK